MTIAPEEGARSPISRQARVDVAVLFGLSVLGLLGFEASFGGTAFLVAATGGLVVGVGVGLLCQRLRFGGALTALAGVAAYFLLGTPIAIPGEALAFVLPTGQSLSDLARGAVLGWADLLTLTTPIGAPTYIAAVPYVAGWTVGLVCCSLAVRWLPRHPRSSWRYSLALAGPLALYVVGVLTGTDEPFLAGIRGIAFAAVTLVWLGWRRGHNQSASVTANRALLQRKAIGTIVIVAVASMVAVGVGVVVPTSSYARFVLRDKITPPFNPLDYPSPLAGFRFYTKTVPSQKLLTVTGLKPGDRIRLATLDSYTGSLWNVVGTDVARDGSGSFDLVGTDLPQVDGSSPGTRRTVTIKVDGYTGVWIPMVGDPETLAVGGSATGEEVHYNSKTGTAALTGDAGGGVGSGASFTTTSVVPTVPSASVLDRAAISRTALPAAYPIDAISAQAQKHNGAGSTYQKLENLSKYLHDNGYLSHGSTVSPSSAGHGANRMIQMFPPNGTLVGDAEQFSSAFALEARALGYPARIVMGFAPKVKPGQNTVTVIGKDVTAWDEVEFTGVGWVPFYPTPTQSGKPPKTPPPPVSQTVTQSKQPNRSTQAGHNILSPVAVKKPKHKSSGFVIPDWVYQAAVIVAIPLAIYFIPLLVVGLVKRRRRRRRMSGERGDERVAGAWDELTDSLAELGLQVPRAVTRIKAAQAVQAQLPDSITADRPNLVDLAIVADEAVFAGQDVADDAVRSMWTTADAQVAGARSSVRGWQRWLSKFRVRSKRGLPQALTSIDATAVTDRVRELVNR